MGLLSGKQLSAPCSFPVPQQNNRLSAALPTPISMKGPLIKSGLANSSSPSLCLEVPVPLKLLVLLETYLQYLGYKNETAFELGFSTVTEHFPSVFAPTQVGIVPVQWGGSSTAGSKPWLKGWMKVTRVRAIFICTAPVTLKCFSRCFTESQHSSHKTSFNRKNIEGPLNSHQASLYWSVIYNRVNQWSELTSEVQCQSLFQ